MRTIGWNVDTQHDFMRPDGKLYVQGAEAIESNLNRLTLQLRMKSHRIVNTADWHTMQSREISDTPDYANTFPPHCIQGTPGAEYIPATRPEKPFFVDWQKPLDLEAVVRHKGDIVIYKDDFDDFHPTSAPHTEKILKILKPGRAIVYGVATNVCVDYAVRGLLKRGVQVYVPTDAIKELPNLPLEETLNRWRAEGAVLTTVDKVIEKYI